MATFSSPSRHAAAWWALTCLLACCYAAPSSKGGPGIFTAKIKPDGKVLGVFIDHGNGTATGSGHETYVADNYGQCVDPKSIKPGEPACFSDSSACTALTFRAANFCTSCVDCVGSGYDPDCFFCYPSCTAYPNQTHCTRYQNQCDDNCKGYDCVYNPQKPSGKGKTPTAGRGDSSSHKGQSSGNGGAGTGVGAGGTSGGAGASVGASTGSGARGGTGTGTGTGGGAGTGTGGASGGSVTGAGGSSGGSGTGAGTGSGAGSGVGTGGVGAGGSNETDSGISAGRSDSGHTTPSVPYNGSQTTTQSTVPAVTQTGGKSTQSSAVVHPPGLASISLALLVAYVGTLTTP